MHTTPQHTIQTIGKNSKPFLNHAISSYNSILENLNSNTSQNIELKKRVQCTHLKCSQISNKRMHQNESAPSAPNEIFNNSK